MVECCPWSSLLRCPQGTTDFVADPALRSRTRLHLANIPDPSRATAHYRFWGERSHSTQNSEEPIRALSAFLAWLNGFGASRQAIFRGFTNVHSLQFTSFGQLAENVAGAMDPNIEEVAALGVADAAMGLHITEHAILVAPRGKTQSSFLR